MGLLRDKIPAEKLAAILAFNRQRASERAAIIDLDAVRAELEVARLSLTALQSRFNALKNTGSWAEIDLGATIAAGTRARYMLGTYECRQAHTKSILRAPTNGDYWIRIEDDV